MTHLGLFAGIGGFELPARWAGWETKAVCEWDSFCQTVLKYYFPNAEQFSDIRTANFTRYAGQIDVLTGGFPCQPYSSAGKRLGKEDERHLWPEMLRAIQEVSPRWVVGENVRGLVNWNGGVVFDEVQSDLEAAGYEVLPFLLPACGVDAPHERYRVWFVAHATGLYYRGSAGEISKSDGRQIREMLSEFGGTGEAFEFVANTDSKRFGQQHVSGKSAMETFSCGRNAARDASDSSSVRRLQSNGKTKSSHSTQDIPDWRGFPTQPPVCGRNDGFSPELAGITVSRHRRESIKAYGNAIVPQVAYQIFKAINQYEK
jgi:DNA (cytosine-5)-methyltransferase 1